MATYNGGGIDQVVEVAAIALTLISCAFATEFVVGDGYCNPASWSPNVSCDYNTWALQNTFSVGDSLVFKFDPTENNVAETSKDAYDGCVASGLTPTITTIRNHSSSPATIVLTQPGTSYFISTVGSACNATRLQLAVTVAHDFVTVAHDLASGPTSQSVVQSAVSPTAADSTPVDNTSPPAPPSSSTDVPTGDATPSTSATAQSSSNTGNTTSATPSHHKSVVGPVVGVTLSVLAVKISVIIYCWRKRRGQKSSSDNIINNNNNHHHNINHHNNDNNHHNINHNHHSNNQPVNNNTIYVNVNGNGGHQEISAKKLNV